MVGFLAPVDTLSPPPTPPRTPTEALFNSPFDIAKHAAAGKTSHDLTQAIQSLPIEPDSPLYPIIQLMKSQMLTQAQQQDQLLSQLDELSGSQASLKAQMADDQEELKALREQNVALSQELSNERQRREDSEVALSSEKEKVSILRAKTEESRRAIMRLQDEAASRRNSESRRSSLPALATSMDSDHPIRRRGSLQGSALGSRRRSLISTMEASTIPSVEQITRRASCTTFSDNRRSSLLLSDRRSAVFSRLPVHAGSTARNTKETGIEAVNSKQDCSQMFESTLLINTAVNQKAQMEEPTLQPKTVSQHARKTAETKEDITCKRSSLTNVSIDEEGLGFVQQIQHSRKKSARKSEDFGKGLLIDVKHQGGTTDQEVEETARLRVQLKEMQEKLEQCEEAKQASEEMVKSLKAFIAVPSNGIESLKLPPLPTENIPSQDEQPKTSYWKFPQFGSTRTPSPSKALSSLAQEPSTVASVLTQAPKAAARSNSVEDPSHPTLTAFNAWSRRRSSSVAPHACSPQTARTDSNAVLGSRFETFSFQPMARNPALMDSPPFT